MTKARIFVALVLVTAAACGSMKERPAPAPAEVLTATVPLEVCPQVVDAKTAETREPEAPKLDRSCETDDDCTEFAFRRVCTSPNRQTLAISTKAQKSIRETLERAPELCSEIFGESDKTNQTAICERHVCELTDSNALFEWAKEVSPEIAALKPVKRLTDVEWMMWERRHTLYVDSVWDGFQTKRRCVAAEFDRIDKDGTFQGWIERPVLSDGTRCYTGIHLDNSPTFDDGWCEDRQGHKSGMGYAKPIDEYLSPDTDGALRYTMGWFTAHPECAKERLQQPHCATKVCERCSGIYIRERRIGALNGGSYRHSPVIQAAPNAPCDPCDPDELPILPRLRAAVRGRVFLTTTYIPGPTFYRKKKDCEIGLRAALQQKKE